MAWLRFKDGAVIVGWTGSPVFWRLPVTQLLEHQELGWAIGVRLGSSPPTNAVAAAPHRSPTRCHNLHGVKSRGISASKLLRRSCGGSLGVASWQMPSFCNSDAYSIRERAHEFCYLTKDPCEQYFNSLAEHEMARNGT